MKSHALRRIFAFTLIAALMLAGFPQVGAKSSSEIKMEIDRLEEEAKQIEEDRAEAQRLLDANTEEANTYVAEKTQIDLDIEAAAQEVENLEAQLHQYNLLIAEKQAELDELRQKQDALFKSYRQRMRVMQERGEVSYWSVLLEADSFSDMLTSRAMIEEIAKADQRMMDEMRDVAAEVLAAKDELAENKSSLELKKLELNDAKAELQAKREAADAILVELAAKQDELIEITKQFREAADAKDAEIAKMEKEYTEAKQKEEEDRKQQSSGNYSSDPSTEAPSDGGFIFPVSRNGYACLTSRYGMRMDPILGYMRLHNGVDLAANTGTPVYASKSGTVTLSVYDGSTGWGHCIVINHGDGFSTRYGHMDSRVVSNGEYVTQGQVIGYVGSTGWSTGPHLHFTIYYNGGTVNPLNYINLP